MYIISSSLYLQNTHEEQQLSVSFSRETDTLVQTLTRTNEAETLNISAVGNVQTVTGDVLDITLQSSLSRYDNYQTLHSASIASLVDPLVLNLDGSLAKVDESQTFLFDLNSDGTQEEISLLGKKNGFLALDKNNNGIIDDGSELFGTQSGDGFADLASYDEDGNGWIDENDSIFSKLQLWQKSALQDNLISLNQAQVGALLLESVDSLFQYKKGESTQAKLQKSSVVLFENGKVGWMSHMDFAVSSSTTEKATSQSAAASNRNVFSSSLTTLKSSSQGSDTMLSALKNRLKVLQHRLAKTVDMDEKSNIIVQILKIYMQIAQLGG